MKDIDIPRIEDFIKSLGTKDLVYLNRLIVGRIKILSQMQSSEKMAKFHLSERVSFMAGNGKEKTGRITKMHKKTVHVVTDDGENWKIAPGYLKSAD